MKQNNLKKSRMAEHPPLMRMLSSGPCVFLINYVSYIGEPDSEAGKVVPNLCDFVTRWTLFVQWESGMPSMNWDLHPI